MLQSPTLDDHRPLILIAEGDDDFRELLALLVHSWEFRAVAVADGREAAAVLDRTRPDLLITELAVRGVNGLELCRLIRAEHRLRTVPALIISVHSSPDDIEAGYRAGADGYLVKPVSVHELQGTLRDLIEDRHEAGGGLGTGDEGTLPSMPSSMVMPSQLRGSVDPAAVFAHLGNSAIDWMAEGRRRSGGRRERNLAW